MKKNTGNDQKPNKKQRALTKEKLRLERGKNKRNTCNDQKPNKKHRALTKAKLRLERRKNSFSEVSSGGHECHMPGSLKVR